MGMNYGKSKIFGVFYIRCQHEKVDANMKIFWTTLTLGNILKGQKGYFTIILILITLEYTVVRIRCNLILAAIHIIFNTVRTSNNYQQKPKLQLALHNGVSFLN